MCAPCNIIQNTDIAYDRFREVVKKEKRIFYGQADRKGGGVNPPMAWP